MGKSVPPPARVALRPARRPSQEPSTSAIYDASSSPPSFTNAESSSRPACSQSHRRSPCHDTSCATPVTVCVTVILQSDGHVPFTDPFPISLTGIGGSKLTDVLVHVSAQAKTPIANTKRQTIRYLAIISLFVIFTAPFIKSGLKKSTIPPLPPIKIEGCRYKVRLRGLRFQSRPVGIS